MLTNDWENPNEENLKKNFTVLSLILKRNYSLLWEICLN